MSKITPKTLSYDQTLPPFLQRLQANNASRDGRSEFQTARPKKARNPEEEAEDEPVYFDEESGETLTKSEWEAMEKFKDGSEGGDGGKGGSEEASKDEVEGAAGKRESAKKEKIAAIGGGKKRKAGKVVGAEDEDADEKETGDVTREMKKVERGEGKKAEGKIAKKKGKKVKLSFGDEE